MREPCKGVRAICGPVSSCLLKRAGAVVVQVRVRSQQLHNLAGVCHRIDHNIQAIELLPELVHRSNLHCAVRTAGYILHNHRFFVGVIARHQQVMPHPANLQLVACFNNQRIAVGHKQLQRFIAAADPEERV